MVDSKATACTMDCPDACSLIVFQDRKGVQRIKGNPDHPFTKGFICAKIKRHLNRLNHPKRIVHPMLRNGGGWRRISWDEALGLCADKIQRLRENPASILHLPSGGAKGVLKNSVGLFFAELGSSRIRGALCDAAGDLAYVSDFGSRENPMPENILHSGRVVNWGKDLSRSSIHMAALIRKAGKTGTRLLCISPGGDGNAPFADKTILIRPGTDRFLAAAVIRHFLKDNRVSDTVIQNTFNWEGFKECILSWSTEDLLSRCGVVERDAQEVFDWYSGDTPTATIVGTGVQRYSLGGENVRFINALAVVSGNMDRRGGGSYYHLNSFANLDLNWTKGPKAPPRRSFILPRIGQEILKAKDPEIKMIWVNGSNIINQAPNIRKTIEAFEAVPFKVVVDAFMTDTAERADLILPCALMLENEDIVGSYLHPFVHMVSAVVQPPKEARDDYSIVRELGQRLDPPIHLPTAEEGMAASLDSPYLQTTLQALRRTRYSRAERPSIPYKDLKFEHRDKLYHPPSVLTDEPDPPDGYPMRLLTLVRRDAIHSQILPKDQEAVTTAWTAPERLKELQMDSGRECLLISSVGEMRVRIQSMEGLHPDVVLCRRGGWLKYGGGLNQLIEDRVTDLGSGAPFYDQYVRLAGIEE
jgi:anaerobic selenocysteine-containing dehydrogenase